LEKKISWNAEFIHVNDISSTYEKINALLKGKKVVHFQNRVLTTNGIYKCFSWTAFLPHCNCDIYAIGQDCTEKVLLEEQLMKQRISEERSVMQAILHGQEMERNEIGKELHDNVSQMLTTVKLYDEMALTNKKASNELITEATNILKMAIDEIRKLSKLLVAPGANELDLSESVQDLIDTITLGKKIIIRFTAGKINNCLPGKIKLTIFRIIQEQLNNILKHAEAKLVCISIAEEDGNIKLAIQDDGKGFDPGTKKKGIGLKNIVSRAELYNGTVKFDTAPGRGCLLEVSLPLHEIFL
jgi:signal transduction histidine kinase